MSQARRLAAILALARRLGVDVEPELRTVERALRAAERKLAPASGRG